MSHNFNTTTITPGDADAILRCFTAQQIPAKKPSLFYRIAIVLVTIAMALLPVIYAGVILAIGWFVVSFARNGSRFGAHEDARTSSAFYVVMLIVGGLLGLFMLKPLLSLPPKPKPPKFVTREEQPALWALVEKLCVIVRAPVPKSIALDCTANASAGFEPGLFAFVSGRLRLTIGLPLVAGMTLKQFVGVLAHEFGHFTQGGGMRLSGIIRRINAWFERVVYERDSFDRMLHVASGCGIGAIALPAIFARVFVWITRRVLWLLMTAGQMLSANLMRQMEFDADLCEARIAGSAGFAAAMRRGVIMGAATEYAVNLADKSYQNGKLAVDIPMLAANCAERLPARTLAGIESELTRKKGGMFDSHPTPLARCATVEALGEPGIFHADIPATVLFRDGGGISRSVTRHYTGLNEIEADKLPPIADEEIERQDRMRSFDQDTLEKNFGGLFIFEIPVEFAPLQGTADECAQHLKTASEKLRAAIASSGGALAKLKAADDANMAQAVASALMYLECKTAARRVPGASKLGTLRASNKEAIARSDAFQKAMDELAPNGALVSAVLHATASGRLASAPDETARQKIMLHWEILKIIRKYARAWLRTRESAASLGAGINAISTSDNSPEALRGLYSLGNLRELIETLDEFRKFQCPFSEMPQDSTMRDFLVTYHLKGAHELANRHRSMQYFVAQLDEAHTRIAGWLMRDETEQQNVLRIAQALPLKWLS